MYWIDDVLCVTGEIFQHDRGHPNSAIIVIQHTCVETERKTLLPLWRNAVHPHQSAFQVTSNLWLNSLEYHVTNENPEVERDAGAGEHSKRFTLRHVKDLKLHRQFYRETLLPFRFPTSTEP